MKQKFYHLVGKAIDADGLEHIVTIVGELTKETELTTSFNRVNVENGDNITEGYIIYPSKNKVRRLRYAYSICHTDDIPHFNENVGIEIAKKRLNTQPLGELETHFKTTLCEDQIKLILFGELKHIMDNIDKFIDKL